MLSPIFEKNELPKNLFTAKMLCLFLIDTSVSMNDIAGIDNIERSMDKLLDEINDDRIFGDKLDIGIVEFNDEIEFVKRFSVNNRKKIQCSESKDGRMNEAIMVGINLIQKRKLLYKLLGVSYYRPVVFLISCRKTMDFQHENSAKELLKLEVEKKGIQLYIITDEDAEEHMSTYEHTQIIKCDDFNFEASVFDLLYKHAFPRYFL